MTEPTENAPKPENSSLISTSRSIFDILKGLANSGNPVVVELAATEVNATAIKAVVRTQDGQEQGRYEITAAGVKSLPCA